MGRFAANLSWLYTEHAFMDRFAAAATDGFKAVEMLFPYEYPAAEISAKLHAHELQAVLINAPPGDHAAGERGLACLPGREAEFRASVGQALEYARAINCPTVHVMSGIGGAEQRETWLANLRWAAAAAANVAIQLTIEPINPRDMPGYFLQGQAQALELIKEVGAPNLGLQMDWYHCQVSEGDVANKLRRAVKAGVLVHVQVAGAPDRREPDDGELRIEYLLGLLDELGYAGWVGCEYRPRGPTTSEGLGWLRRLR